MIVEASPGDTPDAPPDIPTPDATAVTMDVPTALLPAPAAPEDAAPPESDPGWKDSSLELLTGVEVTDFSDSISGETFHALFRP